VIKLKHALLPLCEPQNTRRIKVLWQVKFDPLLYSICLFTAC